MVLLNFPILPPYEIIAIFPATAANPIPACSTPGPISDSSLIWSTIPPPKNDNIPPTAIAAENAIIPTDADNRAGPNIINPTTFSGVTAPIIVTNPLAIASIIGGTAARTPVIILPTASITKEKA